MRKKLLKIGIDPNTHKPRTNQFSNPIMCHWDTAQLGRLQLLQNLLQVINTNPLMPYMQNTTTTQFVSQTLNPFECLANYYNIGTPQSNIPNYPCLYSNLEGGYDINGVCINNDNNNNNNKINSLSGSNDNMKSLENPISLPQLVSESSGTSTTNQMDNSNSDDWDKLMDDDTYWKDIVEYVLLLTYYIFFEV